MPVDDAEKEKRRKKQFKRMGKILGKCWDLDVVFQDRTASDTDEEQVLCLTDIGKRIDDQAYRLGKHGWEDFARDLGGVFNRHAKGLVNFPFYFELCCVLSFCFCCAADLSMNLKYIQLYCIQLDAVLLCICTRVLVILFASLGIIRRSLTLTWRTCYVGLCFVLSSHFFNTTN